MLNDATCFDKIYIKCGYTDLRLGIDGLASLIQREFHMDPFTPRCLFLFSPSLAKVSIQLLRPRLTSHSSLLLGHSSSVRPRGINHTSFPVHLPDLRMRITIAILDFTALSQLVHRVRLDIRFLSVRPRFRYRFFSPTSHDVKLANRYWVHRQLVPLGIFTLDV